MTVTMPFSGSLYPVKDCLTDILVIEGKTLILNAERRVISSGITNPTENTAKNFVFSSMHQSKEERLVVSHGYGYIGEARYYDDFCPNYEVHSNDFQNVMDTTNGTILINDVGFENALTSGFSFTVSGSGITYSGLVNSTKLDGNYYIGLQASGDSILVMQPTISGSDVLNCGRSVFLARLPDDTTPLLNGVGFAFLRQGTALTDDAYKVVVRGGTNSDEYQFTFYVGQMVSSTSIFTGSQSSTRPIHYMNSTHKTSDNYRRLWIVAEWEGSISGTKVNLGYKTYDSNDTIDSVIDNCQRVYETVLMGRGIGDDPYYSTTQPVAWLLNSTNDDDGGLVGIDRIYLEALPSLQKISLYKIPVFKRNTSGNMRPYLNNTMADDGYPPNASINNMSSANPLLYLGIGFRGAYHSYGGGSGDDIATTILKFEEPLASGIVYGSARFCATVRDSTATNKSRLGFSFLRQGSTITSNAYTIKYESKSSTDCQVVLYKGQTYSSDPISPTSTFSGTVIDTSTGVVGAENTDTWIDVRWKADSNANSTEIDVYALIANSNTDNPDRSPGNVDYSLTKILNYVDTTTPYLTTSEAPLVILQSTIDCQMYLRKVELRRFKGWS